MRKKVIAAFMLALFGLLFACMFASCQTAHQVAQRKLRKALRIDPAILATIDKDTTVYRTLKIPIERTMPAISRESQAYSTDSLRDRITALLNNPAESQVYLYKDTAATIAVLKKPDGRLSVKFNVLPQKIRDTVYYPDTLRIPIKAQVLKVEVKAPPYKYFWFWGLILALILETILFVVTVRSKKKIQIVDERRNV